MASGDPNCGLCVAQRNHRWSSLPEIQGHAEDGCPYCTNMLEGLLYLLPDLETKHGTDAQFRFKDDRTMRVYADPNGSLGYPSPHKPVELEYRWFTVDNPPPCSLAYDTSSAATLSHATTWLTNCLTTHKLCNPPPTSPPPPLPTRILDVGPPSSPTIHLILPPPTLSAPYIALSHSWGGTHPLTTTTVNLPSHLSGIPLSSLPPTFLHAVLLTRRLSLRHLWIDSLCILQDSPADWASEASRMAAVYRNSHLTLSATASSSPLAGIYTPAPGGAVHIAADPPEDAETLDILFPEAAKLRQDLRLELRFKIIHPSLAHWDAPDKEGEDSPLLARAWAYQERLLAPRVLHFGRWEAWWECMQEIECECGGMMPGWKTGGRDMGTYLAAQGKGGVVPPKVGHYAALYVGAKGERGRGKLLGRWGGMVEEYSRRKLTYSADRLPAFGGVAGEMGGKLGMPRYWAGLWEGTLPEALVWERGETTGVARLGWGEERPAPSWSWAAVDDAVRFVIPLEGLPAWAEVEVVVEVGEVKVVPVTEDERGRVVVGESYMMLTAPMVKAAVVFEPDPHADPYVPWMEVKEGVAGNVKGPPKERLGRASFAIKVGKVEPLMAVMDVRLCDDEGEWLWDGEGEISCIKMMVSSETFHWLVVRKLEGEGHVYERIGLVSHPYADWKTKKGLDFPKKTIKLV